MKIAKLENNIRLFHMCRLLLSVAVLLICTSLLLAQNKPKPQQPRQPAMNDFAATEVQKLLADLDTSQDFSKAFKQCNQLFEQVIAFAGEKSEPAFRDIASTRRLIRLFALLQKDDKPDQKARWDFLRKNKDLGNELARVVRYGDAKQADNIPKVFALLDELIAKHANQLNDFATLTSAICVVHDRLITRHMNENVVNGTDPIALFDYFTQNEKSMYYGIRNVPTELLVFVVDSTSSPREMQWALGKFAKNPNIGQRFFEINYDHEFVRSGREKQVTKQGYTLDNIQKYGGVCIDQAYYATQVGKAQGIPTAIAVALGGEVGHAWVGFLQANGKKGAWNFNAGRYTEYQGLAGAVEDPQSGELIADSFISLSAEMISLKPEDRLTAMALSDAAEYLILQEQKNEAFAPAAPENISGLRKTARDNSLATQLDLAESAATLNPACVKAWELIVDRAQKDKLSLKDKRNWSDLLAKVCGQKYPDFTFTILKPMVKTVDDVQEQNRIWEAAFKMFDKRPDLAAAVRMEQGEMWEKAGNKKNAGMCYEDIINRFTTAGPFVLAALDKCEKSLRDLHMDDKVLSLYMQTWAKIPPPKGFASPIIRFSNWYRVGSLYADRLQESGKLVEAQNVRRKLMGN
jgi:hypothetical protein